MADPPPAVFEAAFRHADVFVRPAFHKLARDYLDPLKRTGLDTLVLGCTHFPLLSAAIQTTVGPRVRLISSAEETAREVAYTLRVRDQLREDGEPSYTFATTGDAEEFARLGSRVLGRRIDDVETVSLEELRALGAKVAGDGEVRTAG
jgi:glutamate racemase